MATIEQALQVERLEKDIFRGHPAETALQRTFGGQVAGQSLVAAVRTVDREFKVHSLHGYFLRPGNPLEPTVYLVDRIRDGRSFVTRRVTGIQDGNAIFTMSASFHHGDDGVDHQDQMPDVPLPESLPDPSEILSPERAWFLSEWQSWDFRVLPKDALVKRPGTASQQQLWFKYGERLPDDPVMHACTLTYMTDMTLLGTAMMAHEGVQVQTASLDHAVWYFRPFRADEWLLYDQGSPSAQNGRGLTYGRIFDRSGTLVAAVAQEGLTRVLRTDSQS